MDFLVGLIFFIASAFIWIVVSAMSDSGFGRKSDLRVWFSLVCVGAGLAAVLVFYFPWEERTWSPAHVGGAFMVFSLALFWFMRLLDIPGNIRAYRKISRS